MDLFEKALSLFADFVDPKKRVFVGYLLLSLLIALGWMVALRRGTLREALAKIFDARILWSGSARADYQIFVINRLFTFFVSPLLLTHLGIATAIYYGLHGWGLLTKGVLADTPTWAVVTLFSLTLFVVDDFTKYLLHRWMHLWPALWAIHKVHHSAETLTPITVYRVHPLEGVLYGIRGALTQGTVLPLFLFSFGNTVDLYTVLGVNVLVFIFHVTGSNLRHSHVDIRYWPWLEHVLISPYQHQLHHSIAEEHYDKNFGAALAIWDWMFGSLHLSEKGRDLEFGLTPGEASATNLLDIYFRPFRDIYFYVRRRVRRLGRGMSAIAARFRAKGAHRVSTE